MSGGSYNYLCYASVDELFNRKDDLRRMADALTEHDISDAATETERILAYIEHARRQIEARRDRLEDIWHAVEWLEDGDIGKDTFAQRIEKYRSA